MPKTYIQTYPHPYSVYPNNEFISVVITSYSRPDYLKRAIDSIHATADMPFELIVNDDGSYKEAKDKLYGMSDKISTIIFNNGKNMGLNEAANRCISLASSRYILFATDDCWFTRPTFKDVCSVLSKPYIGFICVANDTDPMPPYSGCRVGNTNYSVTGYLGGGITQAFRKDVWREVGGWDLRSTSGQSDNVFLFKILKSGYWKGMIEGKSRVKCANFEEASTYVPTWEFSRGTDCSLPKLFGIPDKKLEQLSWSRKEACQYCVDGERTIPNRETYDTRPNPIAGLNDIEYWGNYFLKVFSNRNGSSDIRDIDWTIANTHGQSKWKDEILRDIKT